MTRTGEPAMMGGAEVVPHASTPPPCSCPFPNRHHYKGAWSCGGASKHAAENSHLLLAPAWVFWEHPQAENGQRGKMTQTKLAWSFCHKTHLSTWCV